jgi:septum formation protein
MSFLKNLDKYKIILASKSPRRRQLLADLGIEFDIEVREVEEIYPPEILIDMVPEYLAKLKSEPFLYEIDNETVVITSDTIVCIDGEILGKPQDYEHAVEMFKKMSGKKHQVKTGVCITSKSKQVCFTSTTDVFFKKLSREEIDYYIEKYKPYDKAGAYGIQEWIGYIGIEKIEGSYFNVMGLPVQKLYEELRNF